MEPWRFFDFVRENGENPFAAWYEQQDKVVRAAIDFTLYQRRVMDDWENPLQKSARKQFEVLTNKQIGLAELRIFPDAGRTFRAFGLYRPTEREFILLVGCQEMFHGSYYKPRNAPTLAMKYKKEFDITLSVKERSLL